MKFLDIFAGIGGFRLGLERAGHECVGHVEIDKFANQSYAAIHKPKESEVFFEDITRITDEDIRGLRDLGIDIIAGGFPCQAFSIAGKRAGFEDTRGTLFFDIARIAREIKPKYLFLENVKGLLNHAKGDTFEVILRTLDELGYDAEWEVLNSKDFGVPQNRERVFIIGHLRGSGGRKVFPFGESNASTPRIQKHYVNTITARYGTAETTGAFIVEGEQHAQKITTPVLTPDRVKDKEKIFIRETDDGFHLCRNDEKKSSVQGTHVTYPDGTSHCLTSAHKPMTIDQQCVRSSNSSTVPMKQPNFRIRKLTPKECWRLQGFPDWAFDRAKAAGVSNSQLYKQAGNAVTVPVVQHIAELFTSQTMTEDRS